MILDFLSGGTNILSGNYWSGTFAPVGGIQLVAWPANSGNVYVGLSGGVTITSGVFQKSGGPSRLDGVPLAPGATYFIPKLAFSNVSGTPQVFAQPDAACSGQARLFWEVF